MMQKKTYARLAALLAAAVLCSTGSALAENVVGTEGNEWHTVIDSDYNGDVYGNNEHAVNGVVTGYVDMTGGIVKGEIYGGNDFFTPASSITVEQSTVTISGNAVVQAVVEEEEDMPPGMIRVSGGNIYGGRSIRNEVRENRVFLSGQAQILGVQDGEGHLMNGNVYGGESNYAAASNNSVTVSGNVKIGGNVYGGSSSYAAASGNSVTISENAKIEGNVYGSESTFYENASESRVTISGDAEIGGDVYGGSSSYANASDNTVTVFGNAKIEGDVYGSESTFANAEKGQVIISDTAVIRGNIYGGFSSRGAASNNQVILSDRADVSQASIYGGASRWGGTSSGNSLTLDGWTGTVKNLYGFQSVTFQNIDLAKDCLLTVSGEVDNTTKNAGITIASIGAGDLAQGDLQRTILLDERQLLKGDVQIAESLQGVGFSDYRYADRANSGLFVNHYQNVIAAAGDNQVTFTGKVDKSVLTGKFIDESGTAHQNSSYTGETPQTLVIDEGFTTNVQTVAGVYAAKRTDGTTQDAAGGSVLISGETQWDGTVYGGYSENGAAAGNTVYVGGYDGSGTLQAANAGGVTVVGGKSAGAGEVSGNAMVVAGNGNTLKGLSNLSSLEFQQVVMAGAGEESTAALTLHDSVDLGGTVLHVSSLAGGNTYAAGDHVTLLAANGIQNYEGPVDVEKITAGVTQDLTVATVTEANSIGLEVQAVSLNPQTKSVAENRTAGAAFVNQGADIAADALWLLDDGYHYGTQTFGAVYGNRSTYDAAGDVKLNGWSEIAGFGNIHRVNDGRLAWGVFYENGTGNYRTWNEFNNEMFRGDGSLLYNGGGAAVRYTKDDGWYYEASFRAGTHSSSMSDAVRDSEGNSYGFDSDSAYWGVHAGLGKVIETERGTWNLYGKYFHTDIEGDSFEMGGDRFSFDDVTSDRVRLGARYAPAAGSAWRLYCGAAWEYEFSGDSHMQAGQFDAPEQSLEGSTVFGEIGTVWGRKDSPWSMDVNLRGYTGEREGFSGMVQLAYAF